MKQLLHVHCLIKHDWYPTYNWFLFKENNRFFGVHKFILLHAIGKNSCPGVVHVLIILQNLFVLYTRWRHSS